MRICYPSFLILWSLYVAFTITPCFSLIGVDVDNPLVDFTPFQIGPSRKFKDTISCERIKVSGNSRSKLESYANEYRVTLVPSVVIPERLHSKIQICFHRNVSLGPCQCETDKWKSVQNGLWNSVMSPFEDRYLDIKYVGKIHGSVIVTVEEDFQKWRIVCLTVGFMLQLLAPVVSSWVPFYYSSSMAIGVVLVVFILLFQAMKLLPTGRKNFLYLSICASVFGAGSYLLHHFSLMIDTILLNLGYSEEMHNPVYVLVLLLIVLVGAALGYWFVRKFVISDDGSVDVGVAQFVKWAMRIIGFMCIFQSTLDISLALTAEGGCLMLCFVFNSFKRQTLAHHSSHGNSPNSARSSAERNYLLVKGSKRQQEFYSTFHKTPNRKKFSKQEFYSTFHKTPNRKKFSKQEFYSTFHKTPNRKKFSKQEWEDFTEKSTRQAVDDWASSPEFADWIVKNADKHKVQLQDESSDESSSSGSDYTDGGHEVAVESSNSGFGNYRRQQRK